MASLLVVKGPNQGQQYPVTRDKTVLGRNPDCHVVLNLGAVSREHAQILRESDKFYIKDLKSRNQTFVNDVRVDPDLPPVPLRHDDRIRICDFICVFQNHEMATDAGDGQENPGTVLSSVVAGSVLDAQPAERLRILLDITNSLTRTLELEPLLPRILDSLFQVFRQADRAFLIVRDEATGRFVPKAVKTRHLSDESTARFSRTILNRCIDEGRAILSEDVLQDKSIALSASISDFRIRSLMCAPLQTADGQVFGVIQVDTQDRVKKFNEEDLQLLAAVGNQAAVAMQNAKLHEEMLARNKIEQEIELAKEVQGRFLPRSVPHLPGYEFFAHYQAARDVGGDYYGFIDIGDGRLAVAVGDVAGKGVPAALLMARLSGDVRLCVLSETEPTGAVKRLNQLLQEAGLLDRFITFVLAVLDLKKHRLTVVNAGHVPPLVRRAASGALDEVARGDDVGLPLGVDDSYEYTACDVSLNPGDVVFLCTDGVLDASNEAEERFGPDRLRRVMKAGKPSAVDLGQAVLNAVDQHATSPDQFDDLTLVSFSRAAK
jgi:serine phosphatase RsbU (regulator of sigma subunit)/pSer/pThr/pTyr-binding forkhead associated (FHA) protein